MSVVRLADPDETLTVTTDARDRRAAEVRFPAVVKAKPGTSMKTLLEGYPETWTAWTYWHAATRSGVTTLSWEEWQPRFLGPEDDTPVPEGELPDPTDAAT